jgi:hypothetical protein
MILAGVTGVSFKSPLWEMPFGEVTVGEVIKFDGGAGGGIDRSTGEGVSPSITLLFRRDRVDRKSGVKLEVLLFFFMPSVGFDGRTAGDCLLRDKPSSPLGEAVRLFI